MQVARFPKTKKTSVISCRMIENSEQFTDFRVRDGKILPGSGFKKWVDFTKAVLIKLPLLVVLLLPTQLVYKLASPFRSKKKKGAAETSSLGEPEIAKDVLPLVEREYDVILYGVTGFTGALAAKYMARTYGSKVRWAIAGRRKGGLEKVREELVKIDDSLENLELVIADSGNKESLNEMCRRTRVVATTVGPFAKYGNELVHTCVEYGTSYCDITGEGAWVRTLIEKYHKTAQASGAKIVNFCGNDTIPWDLAALELSNAIKNNDPEEQVKAFEFYDEIRSAASGGTISTMIYHMTEYRPQKSQLGFNPMDMTDNGEKSPRKMKSKIKVGPGYSSLHKSWYTFFVLSLVNKESVRRSNVLNGYGDKVSYKEQMVLPSFINTITWVIDNVVLGLFLTNDWLRGFALSTGIIPKPGDGPTQKQMDNGYLQLHGYAEGTKGTRAQTRLYFPRDSGYSDTARMLVESSLSLSLEFDKLPVQKGGVYTPSVAMGTVLCDRLLNTGCELQVSVTTKSS